MYNYRRNSEFISAIKTNNIQALMTHEIKNERDDLLMFKYIQCKTIPNYPEGNITIYSIHIVDINIFFFQNYHIIK